MNEFEPNEIPLEEKFKMIKELVMREQGWSKEDWLIELTSPETIHTALSEITESNGKPVSQQSLGDESLEALYNYLYIQYYVAKTGDDPLGLMEE